MIRKIIINVKELILFKFYYLVFLFGNTWGFYVYSMKLSIIF